MHTTTAPVTTVLGWPRLFKPLPLILPPETILRGLAFEVRRTRTGERTLDARAHSVKPQPLYPRSASGPSRTSWRPGRPRLIALDRHAPSLRPRVHKRRKN